MTATFNSRSRSARVTVQIMMDDIVEGEEEFNLIINIPSSLNGITAGSPSTAVAVIQDSTS